LGLTLALLILSLTSLQFGFVGLALLAKSTLLRFILPLLIDLASLLGLPLFLGLALFLSLSLLLSLAPSLALPFFGLPALLLFLRLTIVIPSLLFRLTPLLLRLPLLLLLGTVVSALAVGFSLLIVFLFVLLYPSSLTWTILCADGPAHAQCRDRADDQTYGQAAKVIRFHDEPPYVRAEGKVISWRQFAIFIPAGRDRRTVQPESGLCPRGNTIWSSNRRYRAESVGADGFHRNCPL